MQNELTQQKIDSVEIERYLNAVKINGKCDNQSCKEDAARYIGVNHENKSCGSPYCYNIINKIINDKPTK